MSIATNRLSERDQQMCSIATKHGGSGAAVGMVAEISRKTISNNQARRSRERLDDDLQNVDKKTAHANQVIQYLCRNPIWFENNDDEMEEACDINDKDTNFDPNLIPAKLRPHNNGSIYWEPTSTKRNSVVVQRSHAVERCIV